MKMKRKLIALFLLLLLGCLAACGQKENLQLQDLTTDTAPVQTAAPAAIDPKLCATWVMARQMELEDMELTLEMCLEFREDSTVRQYLSGSSLAEVSEAVFQQRFGSLPQEELDKALQEEGYASREAFLEALSKAVEDYFGGPAVEAFWSVRDGQIILYETQADFQADQPQEQDMQAYTLSEDGKTLTILYPSGDLIFKKA